MNQTRRLLSSLRLVNSFYSNHLSVTRSISHQVITQPVNASSFLNLHKKVLFSSKPEQTLDLILSERWSDELEEELSKSKSESESELTHETVMYILKKLSKEPKKASNFFKWVTERHGFRPSSAIYSLMLRMHGSKESIKQFWVIAKKMKEEGFFIDDQAYLLILRDFKSLKMTNEATALTQFYKSMMKENDMNDVVKEVVDVVMKSDWGNGVEKRLGEMKLQSRVSDNFVLRVLKDTRKWPSKSLGFFKWVSEDLGYKHNSITYNGILRVLGKEDSIEDFWNVSNEMKSIGHEMDLDTYLKISRRFQKCRMFKEAVELYEHMMESPYKPSVQDCSVLLRTIAGTRSPDLDLVSRVVNKFEAMGNSLSKSVYDGIHRSLTSVGQFDEAEKMMAAMKDAGYEPDNITYSQLIYGLCKAGRLEEASKVIDVMESNGCVPDVKTWTILIQGHCSANKIEKALIFLAKMVEKGCDADADLLDVLINAFLCQNKVTGAYELLMEMVATASVKPWQATYKIMIQKLIGERKLEESFELLRLMRKHGYPPFSEPFLEYVSKCGTVDDALEFLKTSSFKEHPSVSAYQSVFRHFLEEGRQFEAKDLLFKCPPHIRNHKAISSIFSSL